MAAITPKNGRVAFVAAWNPDTYFVLDSTDLGTNYGDDPTTSDNTNVAAGDISTQESYDGMNNANAPPTGTHFDDHLINDAACLLYIPAGLAHGTVRGIFHNGGGTNGQGLMIRATTTGVEIACSHNNGNATSQDTLIEEIPDADLPGWFCISCQYNSHGGTEGDMALWLNGTAVRSATRTYTLDWGSGNPQMGDANHAEPNQAQVRDPSGYTGGDWGADNTIDGTGILIANFTEDNPSGGASDTSAGNGNTWHTDYYDDHVVVGGDHTVFPLLASPAPAFTGIIPLAPVSDNHAITPSTGSIVFDGRGSTGGLQVTGEHPKHSGWGVGLAFTGQSLTIDVSDVGGGNITIIGGAPDALLTTGIEPSAEIDHIRDVGLDTLITTGAAPSAEIEHNRDVGLDTLLFTGAAPQAKLDRVVFPDTDPLLFTGAEPTLDYTWVTFPGLDTLVFSGAEPTLAYSWTVFPGTDALLFDGKIPVAGLGGNKIIPVPLGGSEFDGKQPSAEIDHYRDTGLDTLLFDGKIPTVERSWAALPGIDQLVFSSDTVSLGYSWTVRPTTGSAVFDGKIPTLGGSGNHTRSPATKALVFTGIIPTTDKTDNHLISAGAPDSLVFNSDAVSLAYSWTVRPTTQALAFSTTTPTPDYEWTVFPSTGSAVFSGKVPAAVGGGAAVIPVPLGSLEFDGRGTTGGLIVTGEHPKHSGWGVGLAFTGQPLDTLENHVTLPFVVNPVFLGQQPTVDVGGVDHTVLPTLGSLAFTGGDAPTIGGSDNHESQPTTTALAITGYAPSLEYTYTRDVGQTSLTFSSDAPLVERTGTVSPGTASLSFDGRGATGGVRLGDHVHNGSGWGVGLWLSGQAPQAIVTGLPEPATVPLNFSSDAPTANIAHITDAGTPDSLLFTGYVPQTLAGGGRIISPPLATLNFGLNTPTPQITHIRDVGSVALSFTGIAPQVDTGSIIDGVALAFSSDAVTVNITHIRDVGTSALVITNTTPLVDRTRDDHTIGPGTAAVLFASDSVTAVHPNAGVPITNPGATVDQINNYLQCDYSGFRVDVASGLKMTWNKHAVRKKSFENRHPQDTLGKAQSRDFSRRGPKRPESDDNFLEDLWPDGIDPGEDL